MSLQLELDSLSLGDLSQIPDLPTLSDLTDAIEAGNNKPSCLDNEPSVLIFSSNGSAFAVVYDANSGRTRDQIIQMWTETGILDLLGIDSDNNHDQESD